MNFRISPPWAPQRVAHELQVVVEQLQHLGRLQALVHAGEVAQVGEPQHGADLLALAAADGAAQDPLADMAAEIGGGHRLGHVALDMHLDHRTHHVDEAREVGDVVVGEAARGLSVAKVTTGIGPSRRMRIGKAK